MKSRLTIVLVALVAATFLLPVPAAGAEPLAPPCRGPQAAPIIWAFGDSLTTQYAPVLADTNPQWRVCNYGKGGETAKDAVGRVRGQIDGTHPNFWPDVVVLAWATNDVILDRLATPPIAGHTTAEIVQNLVTMREMFEAVGAEVVVATPFMRWGKDVPPDGQGRAFQQGMTDLRRAIARYKDPVSGEKIRPVVHFRIPVHARPGDFFNDGQGDPFHATERGKQYMARKATAQIKKVLAS